MQGAAAAGLRALFLGKARVAGTLAPPMVAPPTSPRPGLLRDACLILVRTQGPVNLGMVARLCGNLAIDDLRLVAPLCEVDSPEARMFSTHSRDFMLAAPRFATLAEAVADCGLVVGTSARLRDPLAGLPMLPEDLPGVLRDRPAKRWAIVFGNEADGLSDEEMRCCQAFVRLRTFGANYSYNLSHAVAITLYALATAEPLPRDETRPDGATRDEVDHLKRYWLHTLERFDYFRRTDRARFTPQLEQLFNRLHLSTHDVQMLWGMFAQMHYVHFGERAAPGHDQTGNTNREPGPGVGGQGPAAV